MAVIIQKRFQEETVALVAKRQAHCGGQEAVAGAREKVFMKASLAQQKALLTLLSRIYDEILAIESTYHIVARPEDFRPRIDYFHDAVRAYTMNEGTGFERVGRLAVESLASDAVMLRQIREKPLIRHPELPIPLSPRTDITKPPPLPASALHTRIDVGVASTLGEGYGHYALLFVSLLAYPAERNYLNRLNECNNAQETVNDVIHSGTAKNRDMQVDIETVLNGITDPELYKRLLVAFRASKSQKRAVMGDIVQAAQKEKEALRREAAALETAHMRYASSQLMLYQEAPVLVKKMAAQGLNIVGEFVETAMREAQKGGRGV